MQVRARMRWRARVVCGAVATALVVAGCTSVEEAPSPTTTSPDASDTSSPTSGSPEPQESAALYTQSRPSSDTEGDAGSANAAVRAFAEAISAGDRATIDEVLHVPTPEDPTVVDQTVRTFADVDWDFDSLRWTNSGFLGPCYLLMGEGEEGQVHLSGTAAWNDAEKEWEFTTDGFPGSADYPELPAC